ncbi:hypothetical protein Rsub_08574 [Raphidocelis subcapitata]|uniref:Uncharacterized protein n=1 Tax=Raphidocelis subcapitata TaxID=307507 RepID=A0A2V0PCG2_9CHLO|nr:hypothetical protein Rsub_08574 [Raphidocelis subcapitata]|eukprot:GBF95593.1 hypothetical protein Rsub_08574 [Raphidocelis subcapitata]
MALLGLRLNRARGPADSPFASSSTADLRGAAANVVHVRRPELRAALAPHAPLAGALRGPPPPPAPLAAPGRGLLEAGADQLVAPIACPELAAAVRADALSIAAAVYDALGGERPLRGKLELIRGQSCPRWHADSLSLRALVTYEGPGTWFLTSNRFARRAWSLDGAVAVAGADEAGALQAEPCDVLYLKGNGFPGLWGMGAVHRSPEGASAAAPRLLLTVDDVQPDCACCSER